MKTKESSRPVRNIYASSQGTLLSFINICRNGEVMVIVHSNTEKKCIGLKGVFVNYFFLLY